MLITFEGVEGSGKTLQAGALYETLVKRGEEVIFLRDPGGCPISEQIRKVVLSLKNREMTRRAEVLLYLAARAQLVEEKIRPALSQGKIVICDRFADSTYAYQVYGRGFDINLIKVFSEFADQNIRPDLTFFLDMPIEVGLKRKKKGKKLDRLDGESLSFYKRARRGYKKLVASEPARWVVIDATLGVAEISSQVLKKVETYL